MTQPKVGDWICFYSNAQLTYSCVCYLRTKIGGFRFAETHHGSVSFESILETRSLQEAT